MGKNNRPGVKAHAQVDELEEGTEETEIEATASDEIEEAANDFGEDWKPPAQLEAPDPRPGFKQRWCRMSAAGRADTSQRLYNDQQGWKPRRIDSIPEEDREKFPAGKDPQYGDIITQGSLVLCEMPLKRVAQRNAYYRRKHDRQMDSMVVNQIAETNKSAKAGFGPIKMSRTSKVTEGRKSIAQAD